MVLSTNLDTGLSRVPLQYYQEVRPDWDFVTVLDTDVRVVRFLVQDCLAIPVPTDLDLQGNTPVFPLLCFPISLSHRGLHSRESAFPIYVFIDDVDKRNPRGASW
jgi:hypothetical protein